MRWMNDFEFSKTSFFDLAVLLETPIGLFSKKKYMNENVCSFNVFSASQMAGAE